MVCRDESTGCWGGPVLIFLSFNLPPSQYDACVTAALSGAELREERIRDAGSSVSVSCYRSHCDFPKKWDLRSLL